MSDEIDAGAVPPAMTAAEWALNFKRAGDWVVNGGAGKERALTLICDAPKVQFAETVPRPLIAATMALANAALPDGDPRKFTHADVAILRRHAVAMETPYAPDAGRWFSELADRIAALLPPREEG